MLAGCAGGGASNETAGAASNTPPGPVVTGLGTYSYEVGGATGKVTLPGTADPVVAGAVALVKAPTPVYVTVAVDNRSGSADQVPSAVSVYTVAGEKVVYESAAKYLNGIDDSKLSVADGNKIIAAYNKANDPVSIGESRTVTMAGTKPLPEDIVRVTVSDAYGDETDAAKK